MTNTMIDAAFEREMVDLLFQLCICVGISMLVAILVKWAGPDVLDGYDRYEDE